MGCESKRMELRWKKMIQEYGNSIVACKTATMQGQSCHGHDSLAMKKEKKEVAAELQLHSDHGFQYTSQV